MKTNKKILMTSIALAALTAAGLTTAATAGGDHSFKSESMTGVPAALTGTKAPIRGLNGGGLPWTIGESSVELRMDGRLEVSFEHLVLAAGANTGKNPIGTMKVIVSCLDATGATVNVSTPTFPVTTATALDAGGNGSTEATVDLPSPCLAPMVFVTSAGGAWFAVNSL